MTSLVNSLTSFFSGFVIFTYLGYMANYQDREIETVAEQGDLQRNINMPSKFIYSIRAYLFD